MDLVDELRTLRTSFHLHCFPEVISSCLDASQTPRSTDAQLERRVYLYRAYIALGDYHTVLNKLSGTEGEPELRAVRLLAKYKAGDRGSVNEAERLLEERTASLNSTVQLLVGSIFYLDGRMDDALRCFVQGERNMECVAMVIQTYLTLHLPRMAQKTLESLKSWADDAPLYQLAESWVQMYDADAAKSSSQTSTTQYIFEELSATYSSPALVCGLAIVKLQQGQHQEAQLLLNEGFSRFATPTAQTAFASLLAVCASRKNMDETRKWIDLLKRNDGQHALVKDWEEKEELFDRCAARFL
ncbi:coatomer epsilon subunit-domain-containing protein [Gaertneriomyces semiglobifer]|nr:coatomer epsilon subunit-domain-containing protein [Gaertneriomyces semiglobifer]